MLLTNARELSWRHRGREITFYLPGMFIFHNRTGKYPAVSITGDKCALNCDHCRTKILAPMIAAPTPALLIENCLKLAKKGNIGVLLSGGCDAQGRLPWQPFLSAIREVKDRTGLFVSVHSGLIDPATALALRQAGVDQALIDVIGDDRTFQDIYHVDFGVARIRASLEALQQAGLPVIPHIVCGLHYGKISGERQAVEMIAAFDVAQLVIVSLMRIPGTPLWDCEPPAAEAVAEIIAHARLKMPNVDISMGCARQRGNARLDVLAIDAGVNRLALPSEEAVLRARHYGLEIHYQRTCCSVPVMFQDPEQHTFVRNISDEKQE